MTEEKIILGGGCFWCLEAAFQKVKGINKITSGYAGGFDKAPTYESVCQEKTGHAEVVELVWNTAETKLAHILQVFYLIHDPTTLNRQGNDVGSQYRSFIGYFTSQQKYGIDEIIINQAQIWQKPITTELQSEPEFYPAEDYHQNYYNNHPNQGYCQIVIRPKLDKLKLKDII
ncbi:MAG: peptide-methionine (S)-S-oxide reductase MsrA [Gammaproteobacteria bacterium]|nr:peptide-methionine (S)-S-oxide reductase MsrA [Gammaproteobacteria bacterium]